MGQFPLQCECGQRILNSWSRFLSRSCQHSPWDDVRRNGSVAHMTVQLSWGLQSYTWTRSRVRVGTDCSFSQVLLQLSHALWVRELSFHLRKGLRQMDVTLKDREKKKANMLFLDWNLTEAGSYMPFVKQCCSQMLFRRQMCQKSYAQMQAWM